MHAWLVVVGPGLVCLYRFIWFWDGAKDGRRFSVACVRCLDLDAWHGPPPVTLAADDMQLSWVDTGGLAAAAVAHVYHRVFFLLTQNVYHRVHRHWCDYHLISVYVPCTHSSGRIFL